MELFRALAIFAEPPCSETRGVARALELGAEPTGSEYTDLFLFQLYPYASVYLGPEGMLGGEARDRIAGFWRAIGETPPTEPDHLAVMLSLYARLVEFERDEADAARRAARHRMRATLLWDHLLSWVPVYLTKLRKIAPLSYGTWARLLGEALNAEATSVSPFEQLPIHLRDAPPIGEATDIDALITGLLTPIRSGVIVTRADLVQAARHLGLGLRAGERRFALKALFEQAPRAVLDWLRDEAVTQAVRYEQLGGSLRGIAEFWMARARQTADCLRDKSPSLGRRELPTPQTSATADSVGPARAVRRLNS